MCAALSYPRPRYGPSSFINLSDARAPVPRVRCSQGFAEDRRALAHARRNARRLPGNMLNGSYYELRKYPERLTSENRLRRASLLICISKALNILDDETLADRWMQLPNTNRLFG